MAVFGTHIYSADVGMQVIDIADASAPWIAGGVLTGSHTSAVAVSDTYVYLAVPSDGLRVAARQYETPVDALAPTPRTQLLDPFPNPFNPRTTIRFELSTNQRVNLAIYALDGRRVADSWTRFVPRAPAR